MPDITVAVIPRYLERESSPQEERFVFSYTITIRNQTAEPVQLLSRCWKITDGNGEETEVSGEGVVGEQPQIPPGESYTYTSGVAFKTPIGTMEGHYEMLCEDGSKTRAPIAPFLLATPQSLH